MLSQFTYEEISPTSPPSASPNHSNPSLEAQIPASKPKSQPRSPNPSLRAQLSAFNEARNLLSIGHWSLLGRCPPYHRTSTYTHIGATGTADHLTLLRLFSIILLQKWIKCPQNVELPLMNVYMYDKQKNIFHFAENEFIQQNTVKTISFSHFFHYFDTEMASVSSKLTWDSPK